MAGKVNDAERQKRIDAHVEQIAGLINVPTRRVMTDGTFGVILTPNQVDALIDALVDAGFKNAIDSLREESERRNAPGPDHNLDLWAIYQAGTSFLDNHLVKAKALLKALRPEKPEECKCRCQDARHCGGCNHEGCGYSTPTQKDLGYTCTCGTREHCIHHCGGNHS